MTMPRKKPNALEMIAQILQEAIPGVDIMLFQGPNRVNDDNAALPLAHVRRFVGRQKK
jgi:hypothetical protein